MKNYKTLFFTFALLAVSAINGYAQREARTSSARAAYGKAAYGVMGEPTKYKVKKDKTEKRKKQRRNKVVKIKRKSTQEKGLADRRRGVWAG
jgi:hypothetical protein